MGIDQECLSEEFKTYMKTIVDPFPDVKEPLHLEFKGRFRHYNTIYPRITRSTDSIESDSSDMDGLKSLFLYGQGIGLPLCARIANSMNGAIGLKDTSTGWTCFSLYLPVSIEESCNRDEFSHCDSGEINSKGSKSSYRSSFSNLSMNPRSISSYTSKDSVWSTHESSHVLYSN